MRILAKTCSSSGRQRPVVIREPTRHDLDVTPSQLPRFFSARFAHIMSFTHEKSHEIFSRARQLMPGGVNSPARAFGAVGGEPVVMHHGEHGHLYDVDGNRYVDFIGSWGPMIIGHRHPRVVAALHEAIEQGTSFGAPTERENELAELVVDAVPSIDKVRLVNSGHRGNHECHSIGSRGDQS